VNQSSFPKTGFRNHPAAKKTACDGYCWKGSPCVTTGAAFEGEVRPWCGRKSRGRIFGARSRNSCGRIRAVAVLGFAVASEGASASANNNAIEIFSLISNLFCLSYIGRGAPGTGFNFRGPVYLIMPLSIQLLRSACSIDKSSAIVILIPRPGIKTPISADPLYCFDTSNCNSLAIKAY
jgi:hypothetical protein